MQSAFAVCDAIKVDLVDLPRSSAKVTLVRHGEDEQCSIGGWSDNKLTENGILQAESLARTLSRDYDVILSSDLPRAKQTAEIIAAKLNCEIEYIADLREVNNGDFKNMSKRDFNARKCKRFVDMNMNEAYPNGESPFNFYERIKAVFSKILQKYDEKKILVVTHGGVITVIECLIHNWQYSNLLRLAPPYATAVEICAEKSE